MSSGSTVIRSSSIYVEYLSVTEKILVENSVQHKNNATAVSRSEESDEDLIALTIILWMHDML